jgi:hypothetical protein
VLLFLARGFCKQAVHAIIGSLNYRLRTCLGMDAIKNLIEPPEYSSANISYLNSDSNCGWEVVA